MTSNKIVLLIFFKSPKNLALEASLMPPEVVSTVERPSELCSVQP